MTASTEALQERTYRFGPLDRPGWLLGMGGAQCLALGAGVLGLGVLLTNGLPVPVALAPAVAGALLSFTSWRGRPFHEQLPALATHGTQLALGRRRWTAPVPLLTGTAADAGRGVDLPPFLDGLELLDGGPLALVSDSRRVRCSARSGRRHALGDRHRPQWRVRPPRARRPGARAGEVGRCPRGVLRRTAAGQPSARHRARRALRCWRPRTVRRRVRS